MPWLKKGLYKEKEMKSKKIYIIMVTWFIIGTVAFLAARVEAKSKSIEIVFSTYWPTSYGYLWLPIKNFAEKIEKQTQGRVKFKLYHSAQLY